MSIYLDLSKEAALQANADIRLPPPILNNEFYTSSNIDGSVSIDYNQVDVAMAFIGYQQNQRTKKKAMDTRSLVEVYNIMDEVALDAMENTIVNSLTGANGIPDLLDAMLQDILQ